MEVYQLAALSPGNVFVIGGVAVAVMVALAVAIVFLNYGAI